MHLQLTYIFLDKLDSLVRSYLQEHAKCDTHQNPYLFNFTSKCMMYENDELLGKDQRSTAQIQTQTDNSTHSLTLSVLMVKVSGEYWQPRFHQ